MAETRDWNHFRERCVRLLERQTGEGLERWNTRVRKQGFADKRELSEWLAKQGVTGYAAQLLVMERFGYPDFLTASAAELIDAQYADRAQLRPIYEAVIAAAQEIGDVVIQARKGYVSLLTSKRTFARVRPATKQRVDLGLRLEGLKARGRLQASRIHETMPLQISFSAPEEVDAEARAWLARAYEENA